MWLRAANVQLRYLAAALLAVAWVIGAATPADAVTCGATIPGPGCCTISAPGTYIQTGNLTAPSGADCIDITAPGVFFDTDGHTITGSGPLTGVGINIAAAASKTVIDMGFFTTIHFFDIGVQNLAPLVQVDGDSGLVTANHVGVANISANNVVLKSIHANSNSQQGFLITGSQGVRIHESAANFNTADGIDLNNTSGSFIVDTTANSNGKSGIVLTRSNSNVVDDVSASSNANDGLWLKASSRNSVDAPGASSNFAGIYIGCSLTGVPAGVTCSSFGLPASNGNSIVDGGAFFNKVGIGIDLGNKTNDIVDNVAAANSPFDLKDGNVGCGTNSWVANAGFAFVAPTSGCINASSGGFAE